MKLLFQIVLIVMCNVAYAQHNPQIFDVSKAGCVRVENGVKSMNKSVYKLLIDYHKDSNFLEYVIYRENGSQMFYFAMDGKSHQDFRCEDGSDPIFCFKDYYYVASGNGDKFTIQQFGFPSSGYKPATLTTSFSSISGKIILSESYGNFWTSTCEFVPGKLR